jgi:hypothetical protein
MRKGLSMSQRELRLDENNEFCFGGEEKLICVKDISKHCTLNCAACQLDKYTDDDGYFLRLHCMNTDGLARIINLTNPPDTLDEMIVS